MPTPAASSLVLGIRPTLAGLQIAPVMPSDWPGFSATRQYRGCEYQIDVRRAGPGNAVSLVVDGEPVDGNVIPLVDGRETCAVEVTVG